MFTAPCSVVLALPLLLTPGEPGPVQKTYPGVDQYGDPLPAHAQVKIGTTRLRPNVTNSGTIRDMAFARDGKQLVLMTDYCGAQVWDMASGKKLLQFGKPLKGSGEKFAVSEDGSRAAVIEAKNIC
jgi:hypothetical protein